MSRAALSVVMYGRMPSEFASHACTNCSLRAVSSAVQPSLPRGSAGMSYSMWSMSAGSRQATAVDRPTPRGSNPMTSYAVSTGALTA